ncbi:MAG: alkaline phosphatase family protein, partial [Candidatus Binatia bacterium]
ELFFDPARPLVKLNAAWALARKTLGFRYLMEVISLDATIVRGSHGRLPERPDDGPVAISSERDLARETMASTDVFGLVLSLLERR